jgi:hypothetical protein
MPARLLPRRARQLVALAGLVAACADDPLSTLRPQIEVAPTELDFGEGVLRVDNRARLVVRNRGAATLEIADFEGDAFFRVDDRPGPILPAAEVEVDVLFRPETRGLVYEARLLVRSNDPNQPALPVPVRGLGGIPQLVVSPARVDFGLVDEGTEPRRTVQLANPGGDTLRIDRISWTSTSVDLRPVALAPGGAGPEHTLLTDLRIEARTATVVELIYAPTDSGGDQGLLSIRTTDIDDVDQDVPVLGRANLAPRAIAWACDWAAERPDCDGVERTRKLPASPGRPVRVDGRESFDPDGDAVASFRWVSVPEGAAFVVGGNRALAESTSRVSSRHQLRLVVKDARGLESLPRPESFVTFAAKDLSFALRWTPEADVDLHLVRPGGRLGDYGSGVIGTSTGSDCSTFNRGPDWGQADTALDDPRLDLDVVEGRGPETIGLDAPEAGAYRVWAHYCDSRSVGVPVDARLEIAIQGQVVAEVPLGGRSMALAPGEAWAIADVVYVADDPPRVEVTPEPAGTPTQRRELCRRD